VKPPIRPRKRRKNVLRQVRRCFVFSVNTTLTYVLLFARSPVNRRRSAQLAQKAAHFPQQRRTTGHHGRAHGRNRRPGQIRWFALCVCLCVLQMTRDS
jgi:hypothetical protein